MKPSRFPMAFVVLMAFVVALFQTAQASEVAFVVGGRMPHEGGAWKTDQSPLNRPFGIDFDTEGNLFIVELEGGRIHKRDAAGKLSVFSGDGSKSYAGDGGPASGATYNGMHNCALLQGTPPGQLLIADSWNHCVRMIDLKSNRVSTLAGTGEEGFSGDGADATKARFNFVMCITLSPDETKLHVTDLKNRRIRELELRSNVITTVAGNGRRGVPEDGADAVASPLVDPRSAAADADGNLYVLERGGHALRVVRPNGKIFTVAGTGSKGFRDGPAKQAQFGSPKHLCTDSSGSVYIADDQNAAIRKYDPGAGTVTTLLGKGFGDPKIRLKNPHGVMVHQGWLWVIDSGNHRILRVRLDP